MCKTTISIRHLCISVSCTFLLFFFILFLFQKQMMNIQTRIFTQSYHILYDIILAFFGLFSRFSTAGDSCQTEHQEKLVCNLRLARRNNMANFVARCTRICFALLMVILDKCPPHSQTIYGFSASLCTEKLALVTSNFAESHYCWSTRKCTLLL